jgi:hypothetical protein
MAIPAQKRVFRSVLRISLQKKHRETAPDP